MLSASEITKNIKQTVENTAADIPGAMMFVSEPVIRKENGEYFLAYFIINIPETELMQSATLRPMAWLLADICTGKLRGMYTTSEKEFSGASYEKLYSTVNENPNTEKEYMHATAVLDCVRRKLTEENTFDGEEYGKYLATLIKGTPEEHRQFYRELSI